MSRPISIILLAIFFLSLLFSCKSKFPTSPTTNLDPNLFPEGMISITIDDGLISAYQNAIPILDRANLKSTNYIVTDFLTIPGHISQSDVLNLQSRGHEIGAHSRTHRDLTSLAPEIIKDEIEGSRIRLLNIGVTSVQTFAYPFGRYNEVALQNVKNSGYNSARSTLFGFTLRTTDKFLLIHQNLGSNSSIDQIKSWIDSAIQNKTWLILLAHHVDHRNTEFSITPEVFQEIVNYLVTKRVKVVTVSQGIQMMGS